MNCPCCKSDNVQERFSKESVQLVFDYECADCGALINDEEDFVQV